MKEMIPSDMLPPSDSESDSDLSGGGLTISNPNRPLMQYDESDEDSSEEDEEICEQEQDSDNELHEKHYKG